MSRTPLVLVLISTAFALLPHATLKARAESQPAQATADSADAASFERAAEWIRAQLRAARFAPADSAAQKLLARAEAERGKNSLEVARALDVLVEVRYKSGKGPQSEALALAERAVRLKESLVGPAHLETAKSLSLLGIVRIQGGDYAGAKEPLERVLAIREPQLGPDDLDVASSLDQLGSLRKAMGDLEDSRRLYERSLAMRERRLPPGDPTLAGSLNNLAGVLTDLAEYARAQTLYERTVAMYETALGKDDLKVAAAVGNLGRLQYRRGNLIGARASLERALAIYEKNSAGERREAAFALNQLALVLQEMGDLWGAKERFERALAIRLKALGPDHPILAITLTNLADLLIEMGDIPRARELLTRALRIRESSLGPDHLNVAATLQSLANLLRDSGERAEAKPLYERAMAIWEKAYGPRHHIVAQAIGNLAQLEREGGSPAAARSLYERALSIEEESLGANHPDVAITLEGLARTLADLGLDSAALATALRCETIGRDHFRLTCRGLSESEGLRYAVDRPGGLGIALSLLEPALANRPNAPRPSAATIWDAVVRSRAMVLDEIARRNRVFANPEDTLVMRLHDALAAANRKFARLLVEGPDDDHPERYRRAVEEAQREVEASERSLAQRSVEFHRELVGNGAGLGEVASSLPAGSALVAYVRYDRPRGAPLLMDSVRDSRYVAFALTSRAAPAVMIPLGDAHETETLVSRWKEEASHGALRSGRTSRQAEQAYRQVGEELRKRIWDPVAKACPGAERVFVIPDGALSLVSFDALPGDHGYLAERVPRFHYLSAERDLPQTAPSGERPDHLLAIGGPAFDERSLFTSLSPRSGSKRVGGRTTPSPGAVEPTYRGTRSACGEFRSVRFSPLPASRREVRDVVALWLKGERGQTGPQRTGPHANAVVELTGRAASEAGFKANAPRATVLHVATHGFFLGSGCPSALGAARGVGGLDVEGTSPSAGPKTAKRPKQAVGPPRTGSPRENPLLLSGLALAGANHRESAGPLEEDGILTAEEIAALNLSGIRCAVLSACDTGAGETQAGEGVLGLRRAFQVAGSRTLIMSLWAVEDFAARAWMKSFYESRYIRRRDIDEAVRRADLELIGARRRAGDSTHPFYWGGFVAAGNWR